MNAGAVDPWLLERLACPRDGGRLHDAGGSLRCGNGHAYPVVDGVPVMLMGDDLPAFEGAAASLARANGAPGDARGPELYLESLGLSDAEKDGIVSLAKQSRTIDAVVAHLVAATNGILYRGLIGTLPVYPIPEIPLPASHGEVLLDVGCSWGRWTIAAVKRGYAVIGVDPSLGAIMAAKRVTHQLGLSAQFVVADARHLPFVAETFDRVFSYSVIQHFSRDDARRSAEQMASVLRRGGRACVQMPTRFGIRCLYHQVRRGFTDGAGFDVRYWSFEELGRLFDVVGPATFTVDCYLGIGLQPSDAPLMSRPRRAVLWLSSALKSVSAVVPGLRKIADSVYVEAVKPA